MNTPLQLQCIEQELVQWIEHITNETDYVLIDFFTDANLSAELRAVFMVKLGNRRGIIIEGERAEQLLNLYSLYKFTDKLIIGSFDLPHGRKLRNLLDSGIATESELINDVILGEM